MRTAAIYDIHGNAPALEAVLAEIDELGVDRIVVGGDALPGPMPSECLSLLRSLEVPAGVLRGNGENDVLSVVRGEMPDRVPEPVREILRWTAGTLSAEEVDFIETWSDTVRLECEPGPILFCHATPSSDNDIFTPRTPEAALLPIFEPVAERIVVCGHTHVPFEGDVGGTRIVNAGSVGMPFGPPGADWLLIDDDLDARHTDFDLEAAAARIRETDYPAAAAFAERYVLSPPSRETMLDMMERGAIRQSSPGVQTGMSRDRDVTDPIGRRPPPGGGSEPRSSLTPWRG